MSEIKRYCGECCKEKTGGYCNLCKKDTKNKYSVACVDVVKTFDSISGKQKRPGVRGFLRKFFSGYQASVDKSRYPDGVNKQQNIDRENDWYDERVVDNKNGEINECHEKLSDHIGHGSAKK